MKAASAIAALILAGCARGEPPVHRTSGGDTASEADSASITGWELAWADEFEGAVIDRQSWTPLVMPDPHNEELQYYTDRVDAAPGANAWLEDGSLIIEA
jgi:hypothetical protein